MALHDVASLGINVGKHTTARPLHETECLIAYLYWIAKTGNAVQRLGYSYWAESCYSYINPLIAKLRGCLSLEPSQLTFFVAHSDIDTVHFEEIKTIVQRVCKTDDDAASIEHVMETTLRMTGAMLDGVYAEYERLKEGRPPRYAFLNESPAFA
jgi:pyrroloquinoline quinone (PQQ) biosynthesis protein C